MTFQTPTDEVEYKSWCDSQELAPGEQELWELHREIDEYIFKAGRIDHIVDDMTKLAEQFPAVKRKRKYAAIECPF